ncbi:hypothetical protein B9Z65_5091 [Elsinoe australis]|uniref:Uncharacterized protein n=1 Tax=Elsinoe australis TaxID=40998 RepID=A0A2P7ZD30_9PEZI|nr:hypothetical protein B9Z65_5091 [Elsinoe australis]
MSARRSVKAFHRSDYNDWTLTHAFFADAGGFVLHTSDFVPFPLNAQQLHYLVTRGYLKMPSTSKKDIADKNKVDTILRLITLWQILWFSLNMLLRAIEGLHITTLELTTLAFILCSFGSFLCWLDKPADVTLPTVLSTEITLRQILQDADVTLSAHNYRFTPLDFISRKEWHWSRSWAHWINIARRLRLDFNPQRKPIDRIQNTMTVPVTGSWYALILLMSYAYAAVFLVAWDHEFPTVTERWLWRFASVSVLVTLLLYDLVEKWGFRWWPQIRERLLGDQRYRRWRRRLEWYPRRPVEKKVRRAVHFVAKRVRNNTVSQDPELGIPLKVQLPLYVLCFFYMLGRAIISFLDIIELRLLPVDAYKEAELTNLFPHL